MVAPRNMKVIVSTAEYPSSIVSGSTGDSNGSNGSSLEGSGDEEVIEIDVDDGNFAKARFKPSVTV